MPPLSTFASSSTKTAGTATRSAICKIRRPMFPRRLAAASRKREAADGWRRRPASPPPDVRLQTGNYSTFLTLGSSRSLCCLHLCSYRSFPLRAPVVTLLRSAFPFTRPPACARSAFSSPFVLSSLCLSCRVVSSAVSSQRLPVLPLCDSHSL